VAGRNKLPCRESAIAPGLARADLSTPKSDFTEPSQNEGSLNESHSSKSKFRIAAEQYLFPLHGTRRSASVSRTHSTVGEFAFGDVEPGGRGPFGRGPSASREPRRASLFLSSRPRPSASSQGPLDELGTSSSPANRESRLMTPHRALSTCDSVRPSEDYPRFASCSCNGRISCRRSASGRSRKGAESGLW
jgi:hypothetical protein